MCTTGPIYIMVRINIHTGSVPTICRYNQQWLSNICYNIVVCVCECVCVCIWITRIVPPQAIGYSLDQQRHKSSSKSHRKHRWKSKRWRINIRKWATTDTQMIVGNVCVCVYVHVIEWVFGAHTYTKQATVYNQPCRIRIKSYRHHGASEYLIDLVKRNKTKQNGKKQLF